jgi:hypothetical protein
MLFIPFFNIYLITKNQLNWNVLQIYQYYTIAIRKPIHTLSLQKCIINNKVTFSKNKKLLVS